MAEYETWVVAAAPAQEQERVASATAQANAEIAWADAQQFMAIALAGAEQVWTTALADAQLLLAQAQGALIAAMGSSFGYSPSMPTLGSVPGIDNYAVTAAGETRYYVDVSFASNPYGWACGGFFGGGFGCGWGGFGGWWGGWGGYFGGWGFGGLSGYYGYGDWDPITGWSGYNSGTSTNLLAGAGIGDYGLGFNFGFGGYMSDPSLPEPQPPLPLKAGYWNLAEQANTVLVDGRWINLIGGGLTYEIVPETTDKLSTTSISAGGSKISDAQAKEAVGVLLTSVTPALGAFWTAHGRLSHSPLPGRPAYRLALNSPGAELVHQLDDDVQHSRAHDIFCLQVPYGASPMAVAQQLLEAAAPIRLSNDGGSDSSSGSGDESGIPLDSLVRQLKNHLLSGYLNSNLYGLGTPLIASLAGAVVSSDDVRGEVSDRLWRSFYSALQKEHQGPSTLLSGREERPRNSAGTTFVSVESVPEVPADSLVIALLKMQEAIDALRAANDEIAKDPIAVVYSKVGGLLGGKKEHTYDFAKAGTLGSLKSQLNALDKSITKALLVAPKAYEGDKDALKPLSGELRKAAAITMLIDAYTRLISISIWAYQNPLPLQSPSGFINSNIDLMSELGDRLVEVNKGDYSRVTKSVYRAHWYADSYLQGINDGRSLNQIAQVHSIILGADGFARSFKALGASLSRASGTGGSMILAFEGAAGPGLGGLSINVVTGEVLVVAGAEAAAASNTLAIGVIFSKAVDPKGLGPAGESAVPGTQNTTRIPSSTGTAEYRVPDRLTQVTLDEIKNVTRLSNTRQLVDYLNYAKSTGRTFTLWVRGNSTGAATKVSGTLLDLQKRGLINIRTIPGTGTWP